MNLGKLLYLLKLQAFQIHFTDRQMPDRKTDNKTNDRYIYIYIYIHTHIHTHTYILGLLWESIDKWCMKKISEICETVKNVR